MRKIVSSLLILVSFSLLGCNTKGEVANIPDESGNKVVATEKGGEKAVGTVKLTKADFLEKVMDYETNQTEWVYKGDKPALIDFYADWCGPCRTAAPVLEELAKEYGDQIIIYKVDTQVEQELSAVFGIQSLPSFLFVPQEGRPTMSNGIARTSEETKAMFKQMIDEILLGKESDQKL